MNTLLIELINPNAIMLLKDLEKLHLIKVLKKEVSTKPKLSTLLRNSISAEVAEEFNESVKLSREAN